MRVLLPLLVLFACDTIPIDPVVDYGDEPAYIPTGDPTLELGYYVEQLYSPLEDGDTCFIIFGLQGGTWTMPALRAQGIATQPVVQCSLTTSEGEVLGQTDEPARFYLAPDTWIEIQAFPVPVTHEAPREEDPIEDLYGLDATLECQISDAEGRSAMTSIVCILERG